ncbi:terminal uridylyltransferase [Trichophyton mentagrophytes]|nr:terminal uridylyltransferase [Trichophyton mentagrophytes]
MEPIEPTDPARPPDQPAAATTSADIAPDSELPDYTTGSWSSRCGTSRPCLVDSPTNFAVGFPAEPQNVPTSDSIKSPQSPTEEWEGSGTIAYITDKSIKKFLNLPPEVHQRLQLASAQLAAEHMIARGAAEADSEPSGQWQHGSRLPIHISPDSAVHQYELARFELDRQAGLIPMAQPVPTMSKRVKPEIQPHEMEEFPYLHHVVSDIKSWSISRSRLEQLEELRVLLCSWTHDAVVDKVKQNPQGVQTGPFSISLKCFGSYRSGYALVESEMDLITITENLPAYIKQNLPLIMAQTFQAHGFASYLLPSIEHDRSMFLRVCQCPSKQFCQRLEWEYQDLKEAKELKAFAISPLACCAKGTPSLHYNIYFDRIETLAHRTDLLRGYRACDDRVYQMTVVVKRWAKARRINNPYNGTLSSYGYTLMVLHYLMNVARPPVIPNLHRYTLPEGATEQDTSFTRSLRVISREAANGSITTNAQSTASLLYGFFAYYSCISNDPDLFPRRRYMPWFHWREGVASIRGPYTKKASKGWVTYFKDVNGTVHNNLLAIEDPITRNINVADKVTLVGVYLMRDEFARAFRIVSLARPMPGTDLAWQTPDGARCEDLFAEPTAKARL